MSTNGKGLFIDGISSKLLIVESDYVRLIEKGTARRKVAETNMNAVSSRSHAVLTITIESYIKPKASEDSHAPVILKKRSKIHLIDLAGTV
jgi:hypothetical protein